MEIVVYCVIVVICCDWFRWVLLSGMKEFIERYEGFVKVFFLGCDVDCLYIVYVIGLLVCS